MAKNVLTEDGSKSLEINFKNMKAYKSLVTEKVIYILSCDVIYPSFDKGFYDANELAIWLWRMANIVIIRPSIIFYAMSRDGVGVERLIHSKAGDYRADEYIKFPQWVIEKAYAMTNKRGAANEQAFV